MNADFYGVVPELAFAVDRSADMSLGHQVQEALRRAIRSGMLRSGERLPSTRQLADQLGVSRGLVVSAYEQLLAEGYVVSVIGSGTRVAVWTRVEDFAPQAAAAAAAAPERLDPAPSIDFGYGVPDLRAFCARDWLWALGEAIRTMPTADLGDGLVEGDARLRAVLSSYHRRVRAGFADPAHTIVVGGFRQGLTFVLAALVAHGFEGIGLEDPGPRDHHHIARRAGLRVSAIAVDEEGVRVDQLSASGARAVLLTPAHQCPTGAVLSATRRQELVQWAHEVDGVVLEDDYDAEFRYDRQPVGALQGLAPDRVVALGSVSKTLAPALRIGWIFTPPRFRDTILHEKYLSGRGVPQLDQVALARLIESGRFDRHLRRVRDSYRQRRDVLVSAVAESGAGATITGLDAGHHALLRLPVGVDEERVVAQAHAAGIVVRGLSDYRVTPDDASPHVPWPATLVIGFGNVTTRQLQAGIRLLGQLIAETDRGADATTALLHRSSSNASALPTVR
ncbi:MAG: PLP-dependent aminotransferase family protein [Lapillicoccus sp.]